MSAALAGIDNVGEFFSQHYVDELLVGDLKELRASWREEAERPPPEALGALARDFFRAQAEAQKVSCARVFAYVPDRGDR